jgi:hypothetical protein
MRMLQNYDAYTLPVPLFALQKEQGPIIMCAIKRFYANSQSGMNCGMSRNQDEDMKFEALEKLGQANLIVDVLAKSFLASILEIICFLAGDLLDQANH